MAQQVLNSVNLGFATCQSWLANCMGDSQLFSAPALSVLLKTKNNDKEKAMIRLVNRLMVVFLVGAIASGVALAKTMKRQVTFSEPVVVNGTQLKSGTYEAVFDDQTNELSILKGRKIVARSPAELDKRMQRGHTVYTLREDSSGLTNAVVLTVTLKDGNQAILNDANKAGGM